MDYTVTTQPIDKAAVDCILIGVFEQNELSEAGQILDRICQGYLSGILDRGDMKGKSSSTLMLHDIPHITAKRIMLVGLGNKDTFNLAKLKRALNAAYQQLKTLNCNSAIDAISGLHQLPQSSRQQCLQQSILACEQNFYQFDACKSKKNDAYSLTTLTIALPDSEDADNYSGTLIQSKAMTTGISLCKDLANLPGNICTPTYLAEQAKALSKKYANLKCHVMEEKEMAKKNMGALLSVARGSKEPAKLITLEYFGTDKSTPPIALVGKGVTFDSGGISIKPAAAMDEMKYDMCGAASVLGTLSALAEMQAPVNVVGVIPTTENLPGGNASKPGDIVTTMSGQTVEILNTDAEGRLILCDALTYVKSYNPSFVVDIATLTGAMVIALGNDVAGLFSGDDELADKLLHASAETSDHAWRLPLWEPYQELIDSPFADMANVGNRSAGSITAACFLARFTEDLRWAHLDIAGVAWTSGNKKGATGRPVPLLTQFCLSTVA